MSNFDHSISNNAVSDSVSTMSSVLPVLSSTCAVCWAEKPCQRSFFKECGHVLCRCCAEQLKLSATLDGRHPSCPFCRKQWQVVTLREHSGKEYDEFVRTFRRVRKIMLSEGLKEHEQNRESQPEHREVLTIMLMETALDKETFFAMFSSSVEKESERLGMERPGREYCLDLLEEALFDAWKAELQSLISHLRTEKIPSEVSRACFACHSKTPCRRSVFTACGHVVCRECAMKMTEDGPVCDQCNKKSKIVNLYEELIE